MVDVMLVPTFDPMMTGIPSFSVITPLAAMATTTEVVADEDWMIAVVMTPSIKPRMGLWMLPYARILVVKSELSSLNDIFKMEREQRKKYRKKMTQTTRMPVFSFELMVAMVTCVDQLSGLHSCIIRLNI